jgi:hypothetical protein
MIHLSLSKKGEDEGEGLFSKDELREISDGLGWDFAD